MTAKGKKPVRTCVACRATADKRELVRFVRTSTGEVHLDPTGRERGRGAYICLRQECFDQARERGCLNAALKVQLTEQGLERLASDFKVLLRGDSAQ